MAVLVAAIMVVAMTVPTWAAGSAANGRIEDNPTATITIKNVKAGETYNVWRMFELASFTDTDNAAGVHVDETHDEAYSYVIRSNSPWFDYLTTTPSGNPYAALVPEDGSTASPGPNQLFWIERAPIKVDGQSDYHVIYATTNFKNSADLPTESRAYDAATTNFLSGDAATIQRFAQAAVKWAGEQNFASPYTAVYSDTSTDGSDIVITGGKLGYYLLGTTEGTLCSLDTNNLLVTIYDKNDEPTLDPSDGKKVLKKGVVYNDANKIVAANWVKNRDANVGEMVWFKTEITAKQGAENYVIHDIMEPGLTFGNTAETGSVVSVTWKHGDAAAVEIPAKGQKAAANDYDNWKVRTDGCCTGCDFEVVFADESFYLADGTEKQILDNDVITVYYTGIVDPENALMYGDDKNPTADVKSAVKTKAGTSIDSLAAPVAQVSTLSDNDNRNSNYTIMTYGNNSVTTDFSEATVTVYQFDVVKTRNPASGSVYDLLAGAEFELYKVATSGTTSHTYGSDTYYEDDKIYFTKTAGTNTYVYGGVTSGTGLTATLTSSVEAGKEVMNIDGLEAGKYILKETKAPTGYNQLAYPIIIEIVGGSDSLHTTVTDEGKIKVTSKNNNDVVTGPTTFNWDAQVAAISPSTKIQYNAGDSSNGGLNVINYAGQELPSTGGMGTTVLYIVGGMLVILAGAYLFFSRKRTA